jgi:CheY-specific phosphatase CheX
MTSRVECFPDAMDIAVLVQQVVWAFLGETAQLAEPGHHAEPAMVWTGCVMVEGPFRGGVTVSCSRELALRIGSRMFETDANSLSDDEARDAFGEFTNVIGGNLKSLISTLLGHTCTLCLPMVASGVVRIPGRTRRQAAQFVFGRETLAVDIFELAGDGAAAARAPKH